MRLTEVNALILILLVDSNVTLRSQVRWRPDDPVTQHPEQQVPTSTATQTFTVSGQTHRMTQTHKNTHTNTL